MSIKLVSRIIECSRQRGALKLLLVVLADFAGSDGLCWPGIATLAAAINESERHTIRLLKQLEEAEDIISRPGRGRGHLTTYAVLCGLSDTERIQIKGVIQNTVIQSTFSKIKGDIQGKEKVTPRVEKVTPRVEHERLITASEPSKVAQNDGGIRHDPSLDPPPPTPATPSTGGGGGEEIYHPESATLLAAAGAKRPDAIRSASRLHPDRVRQILADDREAGRRVGSSLQRCIAEADSPDIAALIAQGGAPAALDEPPPSDDLIWLLPPSERPIWLARFRRAPTPADKREVLAALQRQYPQGA